MSGLQKPKAPTSNHNVPMCSVRTASWEEDSLCSLHIQLWNNQLLEIKHTVLKCSILTTAFAGKLLGCYFRITRCQLILLWCHLFSTASFCLFLRGARVLIDPIYFSGEPDVQMITAKHSLPTPSATGSQPRSPPGWEAAWTGSSLGARSPAPILLGRAWGWEGAATWSVGAILRSACAVAAA